MAKDKKKVVKLKITTKRKVSTNSTKRRVPNTSTKRKM